MNPRGWKSGFSLIVCSVIITAGCAANHPIGKKSPSAIFSHAGETDQLPYSTYLGEYLALRKYDSTKIYGDMADGKRTFPPVLSLLYTDYGKDWTGRKLVKKNRPFNTATAADPGSKHTAVIFSFDNGVLTDTGIRENRPGSLPRDAPGSGDFLVTYSDAAGNEIGRHTIPNPLVIRYCDFASGGPVGVVPMRSGLLEILVPFHPKIENVELLPVSTSYGPDVVKPLIRVKVR